MHKPKESVLCLSAYKLQVPLVFKWGGAKWEIMKEFSHCQSEFNEGGGGGTNLDIVWANKAYQNGISAVPVYCKLLT